MLMLTAIREAQIPLLAAVLLGACGTKVRKALRPHADAGHSHPSALFPAHLRRPIMVLVFAGSTSSSPSTCRTAGPRSGPRSSTPTDEVLGQAVTRESATI
jgi:hypothetical protein